MEITDLPLALSFLLPGFLLLHLFFFFSKIRRISAFYATTWSLLLSLLLFVGVYFPYTAIFQPPASKTEWPSVLAALTQPLEIPVLLWLIIYITASLLGLALAFSERRGLTDRLLLAVGIDLRRHGDIWERLFQEQQLGRVRVYMRDGDLLGGWPRYYSDDRTDPGPELYLSPAFVWDIESEQWKELEDVDGVLIHGNEISRIEFVALGPHDKDDPEE